MSRVKRYYGSCDSVGCEAEHYCYLVDQRFMEELDDWEMFELAEDMIEQNFELRDILNHVSGAGGH